MISNIKQYKIYKIHYNKYFENAVLLEIFPLNRLSLYSTEHIIFFGIIKAELKIFNVISSLTTVTHCLKLQFKTLKTSLMMIMITIIMNDNIFKMEIIHYDWYKI